ncbi:MAG: tetratricopeptide repeat protein [Gammaproteobacteria bacterium]|nr:tetratricopeptide repeat protein [Gammaproteobacteria bacterium]
MTNSVRLGRKGRALALAGGFACCVCAFAQDAIPETESKPPWLEQILQTLERVEAEQRALRQEIEALRAQQQDSPVRGPDGVESESMMDPTALFEAEAEPPAQGDSSEITPILEERARLEAEQEALRREVEGIGLRGDEPSAQDPDSPVFEDEEASESQDELTDPDAGAAAAGEEEVAAPVSEQEESELLSEGDSVQGEASVPPDDEPAFSPTLYEPAARLYEQGREAFRNLNFYDAAKVFREFLTKYPAHEDAGEARYWLGEALYVEGRFQDAIAAFAEVVADDANPRREAARLKTGYAWFELGDLGRAEAILVEVRDQNPGSDLARLAQLRLDRLQRRAGGEQ